MAIKKRMSAEDRRISILNAATPLFTQNGFNGTSVRHIAKAANVSEALLYKHFPSKEAIYKEILNYIGTMTTSAVKELNKLEPGTETLILLVYSLIRVIVLEMPEKKEQQENHERLLFYSLLEDNSYARMVFKNIFGICEKTVLDSYEIALKEGDVIESPISKENRFWFVHHLAMALNLCHQLDEPAFDYDMTQEELAEEASLFCLRGIGMKDEVIKTYFKPSRLKIFLKGLYSG